jgi:hypothetical protein
VLASGFLYWRARTYRGLDLEFEGDFPIDPDPEIGFVPIRNGATVRRHPRAGLAYHLFTSDRRARVSRRGERTPPEVDLLTVGDSFSWGHGVENDDTYTSRLAARWRVPAANFAFAAYGTVQARQMLARVLDLRPRVVVYGFIADHVKRNISPCSPVYGGVCLPFSYVGADAGGGLVIRRPDLSLFDVNRRLWQDFFFAKRIGPRQLVAAARAEVARWRAPHAEVADTVATREQILELLIGGMAEDTARIGASLLVLNMPSMGRGTTSPMPAPLKDAVRRLSRPNLLLLDLAPAVTRHYADPGAVSLRPDHDGHPNAAGHALFAETIDGFLREKGLVPAPGAR